MNQIRSEIEKRLQEKEEEFENTRKNHQRAMDSMAASLEQESKAKARVAAFEEETGGRHKCELIMLFWSHLL